VELLVAGSIATDSADSALPLALGALFVGLANFGDSPIDEVKSMGWAFLWTTLATLVGGLVADLGAAEIALGRRGTSIGVLSMVLYNVSSRGRWVGANLLSVGQSHFSQLRKKGIDCTAVQ